MSSDRHNPDFVFWFLELAALVCMFVAIEERFAHGEIRSGFRWFIAALAIGIFAFGWRPAFIALSKGLARLPRLHLVWPASRRIQAEERRTAEIKLEEFRSSLNRVTEELWFERKKVARYMLREFGEKHKGLKATVRFIDYSDANQADHVVSVLQQIALTCSKIRDEGAELRRSQIHRIEVASGSPENARALAGILDHGRLLGEPVGAIEIIDSADENVLITIFPQSSMPPNQAA
jgi:hypothetical protein